MGSRISTLLQSTPKNTNFEYHSFFHSTLYMTFCRVAVRNLHHSTIITDITDALSIQTKSLSLIQNQFQVEYKLSPLLFSTSPRVYINNIKTFHISILLHTTVSIKRLFNVNCFSVIANLMGYAKNYCASHWVKCDEDHPSINFIKDHLLSVKYSLHRFL